MEFKFERLDDSRSSNDVIKALLVVRTKILKNPKGVRYLIKNNVVVKLVRLLEKPNSKIVDLSLSILGNLMLEDAAKIQIRQCRGIPVVVGIISTLAEESIVCRACRTVANIAQGQPKNVRILFHEGILPLLVKTLGDGVSSPKTKQVIVRAIRMLGEAEEHKFKVVEGSGVIVVAGLLDSDDEELLKAVTKCLAHFTHHGDLRTATQVLGENGRGFVRLVELAAYPGEPKIPEAALACLVNLSHLTPIRPNLGNAGTIAILVEKLRNRDLNENEIAHAVTALCMFCRESVNRMKLRDAGGLKLFVELLGDKRRESLHDRTINSLLQFTYDSLSLYVLQQCGLIPVLLNFLADYTRKISSGIHRCEDEICASEDDKVESKEVETKEYEPQKEQPKEADEEESESEEKEEGELDEEEEAPEDDKERTDARRSIQFRVNSPSYQAVQEEFQEFQKFRDNLLDFDDSSSFCQSPDRSPVWSCSSSQGYSPAASSTSSSPIYYSPLRSDSPSSSDNDEKEDDHRDPIKSEVIYSPIERFSEEEEEEEEDEQQKESRNESEPVPSTSSGQTNLSPPRKRTRKNSNASAVPKVQSIFDQASEAGTIFHKKSSSFAYGYKKENHDKSSRIGWILQILSRLSQSEKPHPDISSLGTTQTIVKYLCVIKEPPEDSRAVRVLTRLSKNLYCIMAFIYGRHLSWLRLKLEGRCTLSDSPCASCLQLRAVQDNLQRNISLLAETGYAEGEMCHKLIKGTQEEKQSIAISAPIVARPRKLLRNLLITHDGLDILVDILENESASSLLFQHGVLSINILAAHLGIVSPNLKLMTRDESNCHFNSNSIDLKFILDDGSTVNANRGIIIGSSLVFDAMLSQNFVEASQSEIKLPMTSRKALVCLLHFLYGCRWCREFKNLDVSTLLELASLSDKYLLNDFNQSVSHEIVERCLEGGEDVIEIYKNSLQKEYPVCGVEESLSRCTVHYLMVGNMPNSKRVDLFATLIKSPQQIQSDFLDDINKILSDKLLETR